MSRASEKSAQVIKPTVNDIARHAGVSLATVDRVLNERPGVRTVTIERVTKAVNELGYIRDTAAANLARRRVYRFVFLLPARPSEFLDVLQCQISAQSKSLVNDRTNLRTLRLPSFDSREVALALDKLNPEDTDGVAILAPETPTVREAVARTQGRGIAVVALLTDLPSSSRDHFIGIDNTAAGKTAAMLMGRFAKKSGGNILVLTTGARLARDHLERRYGFDDVITRQFPCLNVLPSIETQDDELLTEKVLQEAFSGNSNITGIYSTSASNTGLIKFLETCSEDLVAITHDLSPLSRAALNRGTLDAVISQDTGHIVRSAVRLMRSTVDAVPYNETQERIRIEIFLKENLPAE